MRVRFVRADVVLLPGLHGSRALFSSFVALAPAWARCRPLALPSIGGQTFDALAESLLPELKPLEGFVLLGESFSGPIAARLAFRLGQKVALLVLCNPLVEMPFGFSAGLAAAGVTSRWMPAWCAAALLAAGDRALGREALREVRLLPRETLEGRLAAAFSATVDELAPLLGAPLLAVLGSKDRLVSRARTRALLRGVPFSTAVDLSGPHLIVQAKPAEVWDAISDEFESAA